MLDELASRLGNNPSEAIPSLSESAARQISDGLRHRFVGPENITALLLGVRAVLRKYGSIEGAFKKGFEKRRDVVDGLEALRKELVLGGGDPGFLVSEPRKGSTCKRQLMFLRWMVRDDGIDLGLWRCMRPDELLVPLDTHVHRVSILLGLLPKKAPKNLKSSKLLTEQLKAFDPVDPVRFDFALAHIGISGSCKGRYVEGTCEPCPLFEGCAAVAHP